MHYILAFDILMACLILSSLNDAWLLINVQMIYSLYFNKKLNEERCVQLYICISYSRMVGILGFLFSFALVSNSTII